LTLLNKRFIIGIWQKIASRIITGTYHAKTRASGSPQVTVQRRDRDGDDYDRPVSQLDQVPDEPQVLITPTS
jgi:hypothetical protein